MKHNLPLEMLTPAHTHTHTSHTISSLVICTQQTTCKPTADDVKCSYNTSVVHTRALPGSNSQRSQGGHLLLQHRRIYFLIHGSHCACPNPWLCSQPNGVRPVYSMGLIYGASVIDYMFIVDLINTTLVVHGKPL